MARQYTENQEKAISHSGHNILVAASAGSGKTTVLIERLVRKILAGASVDEFLIVTFTNAAAAEMKERLEVAITEQIGQVTDDQQKRFLLDQLALLPVANVSTIDSFALKLIDTYYYKIGLDPSYRLLADQAELNLLKDRVIEAVFADFYDQSHPDHEAFLTLVNNFANPNQDQNLKEKVLKLADFALARPDGPEWLASLAGDLAAPAPASTIDTVQETAATPAPALIDQNNFQKFLAPKTLATFNQADQVFTGILQDIEGISELNKTANFVQETLDKVHQVQQALTDHQSFDTLRELIASDWGKIPQAKTAKVFKEDPDLAALLDAARTGFSTFFAKSGRVGAIVNLNQTIFALTEDQWQQVNAAGNQLVSTLVTVTQAFLDAFAAKKREENLLDFSDAEQLSLLILQQEDVLNLVQSQFQEILVDEYQDINRLQETFLKSLSNGENMYMVGDVKQSIYGFRQADPSLFTGKYFDFARDDSPDERIELAENFRSENNVTTVINQIFTQLMDEELGDIPYQDSAKLIAAASYPKMVPAVFHLDIIEQANKEKTGFATDESGENQAGPEADNSEKRASQYRYLAQKIQGLIQKGEVYDQKAGLMRPVKFSDIAILTRSKTGYVELLRTLNQAGIPVQSDGVGNYYQVMEVYLVLDLLRIVDNPHQDIPLAAVLRSPIFAFDENDLAEIRLADRRHDFYTAVVADAKSHARSQRFLEMLGAWQSLARQNDLVGLVLAIYQDTGWLDYAGGLPGGNQRQANLHALYEKAGAFQENGQSGLYAFIQYIEEIQKNGQEVGEVAQESAEESVALMTIHASKGLEFPIVILPELEKDLNARDMQGDFLVQKDAGVGVDYLEPHAKVKVATMAKYAVKEALQRQAWSEEMRLYYVALTRAKQQLYLVGTVAKQEDESARPRALYLEARSTTGQFLGRDLRLRSKSYLDWTLITLARLKVPVLTEWLGEVQTPRVPSTQTPQTGVIQVAIIPEEEVGPLTVKSADLPAGSSAAELAAGAVTPKQSIDTDRLRDRLNYQYPNWPATQTAAYQSVSEIKSLFEDPDQGQLAKLTLDQAGHQMSWSGHSVETKGREESQQLAADNRQQAQDGAGSNNNSVQGKSDSSAEPATQANASHRPDQRVLDPTAHVLTTDTLPVPAFEEDGQAKPAPTAVGTATHLILQLIDFNQPYTLADLEDLLASLVADGKVLDQVATLVDLDQILDFLQTEMAQTIARHSKTLHRENPFSMLVPANQVYPDLTETEPILIHGIIDGYFIDDQQKTITLFDYKTDYVAKTPGPKQNKGLAKIRYQYTGQIRLYQTALQQEYPGYQVQNGLLILLAGHRTLEISASRPLGLS
ncbi:helicase-exonuclease AddAB subunit AddA [Fructobacillus evanidus]|uniref:ATP-dependent helicase/nuclease subunit A n=1 Tax=Fructobacillus evanidus TaxID=3064281 RepID=A0ABM9MRA0_9LACO|nr:3<92>-5<92> helicase subunit RecB of the DNA repair enzyme RecBCD (exonuclease V) (RecB) [Fructobacillus sp. LMG 32999]CAK1230180.1 3<92>-5<92> helicase subunit RecB of the DNA repair enzyme RecBCD (exonuclease V) (RecB) [Fructobacillus sp. LMG 32999]CAK1234501.1 3<92>-5<92> helicase subunit RecB of the DNA repair enzyme RecBCD (exonuclease V) (RecB) [Fructobacillus sp. LMG 32999]CAK1236079.1 3<92>-5<92> helicase subunit RecB of the DNA repair enzyme RecBCD (exonuclease V) (RecB) [Fructobacil